MPHLLSAFAEELEYQVQRQNADVWGSDDGRKTRDKYADLIAEARASSPNSDEADFVLDELIEALSTFAPPNGYFGAHFGNGADFGSWPYEAG